MKGAVSWALSGCVERIGSMRLQQLFRVAGEQLLLICRGKIKRVERVYCRLDRSERGVGREYHLVGAKKFVAATQRMSAAAEHRSIGIEVAEIIEVWPLQRRKDLGVVL